MYYNDMLVVELIDILSSLELEINRLFESANTVEWQSYRLAKKGMNGLAEQTYAAAVDLYTLRETMQDEAMTIRAEIIRQEDEMDSFMNYCEDKFIVISYDAYDGITDRHGDFRLAKDLMDRTISPSKWMRSANSRIRKDGKRDFKRLHRERMEMMA